MRRLTLEHVFGMSDERVIDTVRPKPRLVSLPRWPLLLMVALLGVAVARHLQALQGWEWAEWSSLGLAALGMAILTTRVEERTFSRLRSRHVIQRVLASVAITALGLMASASLLTHAHQVPEVGQPLLVLGLFLSFWLLSASFGSLVILIIDSVLRVVISDFRRRIVFAVLSLIILAFLVCGFTALYAVSWLGNLVREGVPEAAPSFLAYSLADSPLLSKVLLDPRLFTLWAFVATAVMTLPAVLSVCSKLAENVTERITPLLTAFERVAGGDRSVHLEEAGTEEFLSLAFSFNEMVDKLYLAERIERAFGKYVSSQVLDRIRAQRGSVRLPAELRTASVFFSDIRGFTPMSERLPPAAVVDLLNRYLDQVVPLVEEYQGFINKFIGDAVVVVFNGPLDQPDHAERMVSCAIAVQQLMTKLNAQNMFAEVGQLEIGIGGATGPMLCGNVGTKTRLEYTVIGDTVNLASRMMGHARGGEVWVSEATARGLPATLPAVPFEPLKFKGKDRAVIPYSVWPPLAPGSNEERGRS